MSHCRIISLVRSAAPTPEATRASSLKLRSCRARARALPAAASADRGAVEAGEEGRATGAAEGIRNGERSGGSAPLRRGDGIKCLPVFVVESKDEIGVRRVSMQRLANRGIEVRDGG